MSEIIPEVYWNAAQRGGVSFLKCKIFGHPIFVFEKETYYRDYYWTHGHCENCGHKIIIRRHRDVNPTATKEERDDPGSDE